MRLVWIISILMAVLAIKKEAISQTPLGINYQGIARSADGNPLISQNIGLRISITNGPNGSADYSEEHHTSTNEFGLFAIVVGQGQSSGNIGSVNWGAGNKWLQVELDPVDNNNYQLVGSQQMMSVPYALYSANSAGALTAGDGISINNGKINNTWPDQPITLTGTGAATVSGSYPSFTIAATDNVDDADADPTNEIQTLTKTGNQITLSDGGTITDDVNDADADASNEIQDLAAVLAEGADAGNLNVTNLADPIDPQDAATKNYVDIADGIMATDIANNASAISTESTDRTTTDTGIQSELDATQIGAGLDATGTYTADATTMYISGATSLQNADKQLDTQVTVNEAGVAANLAAIGAETTNRSAADTGLQTELDASQVGAGLDATGTYTADGATNYIAGATSLKSADMQLDTQVAVNEAGVAANLAAITSESSTRTAADTGLQTELDATQAGAGLDATGVYTADGTTNYISGATSLKNADKLLDTKIAVNEGAIATNAAGIATNSASISTLATALNTNYAFKVDFTYSGPGGSDQSMIFSSVPYFDNGPSLSGNSFTAMENGVYVFVLEGRFNLGGGVSYAAQINIQIGSFKYWAPFYAQAGSPLGLFSKTFIFSLTAGQTVTLTGDNIEATNTFLGTFAGFKL